MIHPTTKVSQEVKRKSPLGTRFYSFQPLHWIHLLIPKMSKFYLIIISRCCVDHVSILFMVYIDAVWEKVLDHGVLLLWWWLAYDRLFLSDSCTSCCILLLMDCWVGLAMVVLADVNTELVLQLRCMNGQRIVLSYWLPIDYRITYKLCLNYAPCAYQPCATVLIGLCSDSCTFQPSTWSQILLTQPPTSSQGAEPSSASAVSVMLDPLLGTVFHTT